MTMLTSGLTSSNTDQWATPQYLFDILDREFHFTLDVCADETNHKCERYFTKEQDGLLQKWEGVCWMNPPYGKTIGRWMEKARLSARGGRSWSVSSPRARTRGGGWRTCARRPSAVSSPDV